MRNARSKTRASSYRKLPVGPWLKHNLRNFVTENIGLKLISLLLAIMLFGISRQPVSEVTLVNVPLELRGLQSGLEISGDVPLTTVSVRLRGPQNIIRTTTASQIGVVADLSHKGPGERVVQLDPADVSRPDNVEVLRIEPSNIRLLIEQTIHKAVPVQPQYIGKVMEGYEVRGFPAQPATIEIAGPQSHVAAITHASTESIQLDGRQNTFTTTVDVDLRDRFIRVHNPGPVIVTVNIVPKQ